MKLEGFSYEHSSKADPSPTEVKVGMEEIESEEDDEVMFAEEDEPRQSIKMESE